MYQKKRPNRVFIVFLALATLALTYLGGIARIAGAFIAGALASGGILTQLLGGNGSVGSKYQTAMSGVLLIVVAIAQPNGIAGGISALKTSLKSRSKASSNTQDKARSGVVS